MESIRKPSVDDALEQSSIVQHLREQLGKNPPQAASTDDIKELRDLVDEVIPAFYGSLNTPDCVLRPIDEEGEIRRPYIKNRQNGINVLTILVSMTNFIAKILA